MQKGLIVHTLLINDKGEMLILQRSKQDDVFPEHWDLPGGTLEDGEDLADGAIRETKEEAGMDISNPKLFFHESNVDVEKNKQFITLIFSAKCTSDQVVLNPADHQQFAWVEPSEIGKYKTVKYLEGCIASYQELK